MRTVMSARLLAVLAAIGLAGCVSTSTRPEAEVSDKDAAQYNMQLGVSYLRQGELQTAQAKLEKAIEQDPSLAAAHAALGLVFERLGDGAGAERQYRRAVSAQPDDPDSLNSLAVFLCLKKQDTREALGYFDRAVEVPLSRTRYNRAMVYTNAGTCAKRVDAARAEKYLRAALNSDANYREAMFQLADVMHATGSHLQSRAFLQRYLSSGAVTPEALWLGVRVETALGQPAESRKYAERLQREFPQAAETALLLEGKADGR
jgi:type IV pilus assembly protein PilF